VAKASEGGVFHIARSSLEIRRMLLLSMVPAAIGGAFRVLVTLYGEKSLNLGYISTASLFLPSVLGTLVGQLAGLKLIKAVKAIKVVMISGFVCTLSFMFIGFISNVYCITFLIFLSGAAGGLAGNLTFAHYHSILEEAQRGRANAAYNIISNLFVAISGLLSGWLAELYGIGDGIVYMGLILAVLFLIIGGTLFIDYRVRVVSKG
jgi:MFS family permease